MATGRVVGIFAGKAPPGQNRRQTAWPGRNRRPDGTYRPGRSRRQTYCRFDLSWGCGLARRAWLWSGPKGLWL
ncbi:MAG: hypothetical protein WKF86_03935, partial [Acidimicrobiales bacterium]